MRILSPAGGSLSLLSYLLFAGNEGPGPHNSSYNNLVIELADIVRPSVDMTQGMKDSCLDLLFWRYVCFGGLYIPTRQEL